MGLEVRSLVLLRGLRIQCCHKLQHRSQTWLRTGVTVSVAEAGSHSSDSVPSLGTSIWHGYNPKKQTNKKFRLLGVPIMAQWAKDMTLSL